MADHENALMGRQELDLRQRNEGRTAQSDAYLKALKSALVMNMRDASFSRPEGIPNISFSGGARPSALGAQGKEAASVLNNQALQSLMGGSKFDALPALEKFSPSALPKAGLLEKITGAAGMIGGALKGAQATAKQNETESIIKRLLEQAQADAGAGLAGSDDTR
jgi:hypothetical protein